ncbi:unnamed protein product [Cuscuta epithymum]|uniref:Uncharacterized protein n=1 Tax=Cuscuta epithymum TaxID=186058 RepID=A0AAV0DJ10_9ASTE|nr:unnamed protein product [Cuscuta epithymum]
MLSSAYAFQVQLFHFNVLSLSENAYLLIVFPDVGRVSKLVWLPIWLPVWLPLREYLCWRRSDARRIEKVGGAFYIISDFCCLKDALSMKNEMSQVLVPSSSKNRKGSYFAGQLGQGLRERIIV